LLAATDLHEDLVLIRKIKRMQQAEAQEGAESDSEDEVAAPRASLPKEEEDDDVDEKMSDAGVPATQAPPRSSIVVDLGDSSDEDVDEDEV
jgi:hypothetical protein